MKKILMLIAVLLFTGCSIKSALKTDPLYEKTLTQTQRGQIINSLETKALIDVVYLNPLYKDKFKKPTFLIGVYNGFDNQLTNAEFSITLNGKKPLKISKEIPSYILYKNYPFYNEWMTYYIVTFDNTDKPYKLVYKSKHWGSETFTF